MGTSARLVVTAFGLLALVAAPLLVDAEAPPVLAPAATEPVLPDVRFEVASIKRNKEAEAQRAAVPIYVPVVPGRAQTLPGGLVRGIGMSVRELIRDAYGYRNRAHGEITGWPDWTDKERYDLQAKADYNFPGSTSMGLPPAAEAALRTLLAERFNLKVRMEVQRRPIYELVLHRADGRLGPNLVPSKGGCRSFFQREPVNTAVLVLAPREGEPQPLPPCGLTVAAMGIFTTNMPMSDFVRLLALRPQINRTVIDRTGLTGGFDINLRFFEPGDPGAGNLLPAIKPLLESQFGLTLRDAEGPVEILVIERIERPSEN
jgi:bla regulator protein blaR1